MLPGLVAEMGDDHGGDALTWPGREDSVDAVSSGDRAPGPTFPIGGTSAYRVLSALLLASGAREESRPISREAAPSAR